uniref:Uncharacterized protein n=1 Tax=Spironucleus salmonicida TaxID=348837 RepID=V6LX10_9EUKA|eukprot:EST45349.1 Hypothetical protein SS50377_14928 [Spironucleus salmonicida]
MKIGCAINIPIEFHRYLIPYNIALDPNDPESYLFTLSIIKQPSKIATFILQQNYYTISPTIPLPSKKFKYQSYTNLVSNFYITDPNWPIFNKINEFRQENGRFPRVRTTYENDNSLILDLSESDCFLARMVEFARDFERGEKIIYCYEGFENGICQFILAVNGDLEM